MLETITIHAKPKAATPATVGETKAPVAKEGAGASDFQDVLQTARRSIKPAKGEAGSVEKGQGAIREPKKARDTETKDETGSSADANVTTEGVDGATQPEVPQHETPRADKDGKGHEGDDKQAVNTTDADVVTVAVVAQQIAQPVTLPVAVVEPPEEKADGAGDGEKPILVRAEAKQGGAAKKPVQAQRPEEIPEETPVAVNEALPTKETQPDQAAVKKPLVIAEHASRLPKANAVVDHKAVKVEEGHEKDDEPEKSNETDARDANVKVNANTGGKAANGGRQQKLDADDAQGKDQESGNGSSDAPRLPDATLPAVVKSPAVDVVSELDKTVVKAAVMEKVEPPVASAGGVENPKATSANIASKAQELPGGEGGGNRESTFDQIVLGLRGKLDARNGKAEIQLNPPNLGFLRVSVNLANGTLTAQFQSDNASVRDLLLSQMDKLKSVLEGQGLAVDKLAVGPQANVNASGPQSVLPPQRFPDSANPDGRSGGNYGYSGQQQRQDAPRDRSFAAVWQEARKAPIDLVA